MWHSKDQVTKFKKITFTITFPLEISVSIHLPSQFQNQTKHKTKAIGLSILLVNGEISDIMGRSSGGSARYPKKLPRTYFDFENQWFRFT